MEQTPRIGFILYSLSGGGTEKRLLHVIRYFLGQGMACELILFQKANDYPLLLGGIKNLKVHYLFRRQAPPGLLKIPALATALFTLVGLIRRHKLDTLFTSEPLMDAVASTASGITGAKHIVNVCIPPERVNGNYRLFLPAVYRQSAKIICISRGLSRHLIKHYGVPTGKITLIPNGLLPAYPAKPNPAGRRDLKKMVLMKNGGALILSLGRLEEQKNPCGLIPVFAAVHRVCPSARLVFVGQGTLRGKMERLIRAYGLKEAVAVFDFTQTPEPFLSRADICVFNSHYEGFGNAILEAMAAGVPVISTNCPYGPEEILAPGSCNRERIIRGKYGVLIPVNRPADYFREIVSMLRNKKRREQYRIRGVKRVADFPLETMLRGYFEAVVNI